MKSLHTDLRRKMSQDYRDVSFTFSEIRMWIAELQTGQSKSRADDTTSPDLILQVLEEPQVCGVICSKCCPSRWEGYEPLWAFVCAWCICCFVVVYAGKQSNLFETKLEVPSLPSRLTMISEKTEANKPKQSSLSNFPPTFQVTLRSVLETFDADCSESL